MWNVDETGRVHKGNMLKILLSCIVEFSRADSEKDKVQISKQSLGPNLTLTVQCDPIVFFFDSLVKFL